MAARMFAGAKAFLITGGTFVAKTGKRALYFTGTLNFLNINIFPPTGERPQATIAREQEQRLPRDTLSRPQCEVICNYWTLAVAGISVAGLATLRVPTTDPKLPSSGSLPALPSPLEVYGRDEFVQPAVAKILHQKSFRIKVKRHISIKGGPGMGKTTTATGIIYDPRIVEHFGATRHWVSCREASGVADDMKAQKLLELVSDSLGLDLTTSDDRRKDIKYFLDNNNAPRILVIDNFETMWVPPEVPESTEEILKFLAQFPQLTIVLTTRNVHDPATHLGVSWYRFEPIQPLSLDASRTLFMSLSPPTSIDNRLDDLLRAADCIPLPIVLLASSAQANYNTSRILENWNNGLIEHNKPLPLSRGDPMNILDHSIATSLEGPALKSYPEAPVLLRIIAGLPGGIRHDNIREIVPLIHNVEDVAATLVRSSLLNNQPDVLQMHSTIRSYMLGNYPLGVSHKKNVQAFYFRLINEAGNDPGAQNFLKRARRLSDEEINAQALLLQTLDHDLDKTISIVLNYLDYLMWNTPSIDIAKKVVELLRNRQSSSETGKSPSARKEAPVLASISTQINTNEDQGSALRARKDICQRRPSAPTDSILPHVLLRLAIIHFRLDHYLEAIDALEEAKDWCEENDQSSLASQAGFHLAEISRLRGNHTRARQLYLEAYDRSRSAGDFSGMATAQRGMGIIHFQDGRFSEALELIEMARQTCSPDDHACIADNDRELGRVYRNHNQTESIRLSTKARNYYLRHGPQRHAAIALYQKSIALYLQGEFAVAETGLNDAFEEFKFLRNDAQMGYCVFHLAEMNRMRGSRPQALALFRRSETMFEHMENKFMVGLSLKAQAELYAKLCRPDEAKEAYTRAHALMDNLDAKEAATAHVEIHNIPRMCELAIWERHVSKYHLSLLLIFVIVPCLLLMRKTRWRR